MRPIDADELLSLYEGEDENLRVSLRVVKQNIKDMSIIDAEPTKHGRWIDVEPAPWGQVYETCSECGTRQTLDKGNDNFCGVCGAKMDEAE